MLYGRDVHKTNISSTMGDVQFILYHGVYKLSRQRWSNYRCKEIEEGDSSNSMTTWAKRKRLNLPVRNAKTNFGRQSKPSSRTSLPQECVVKIVKKDGNENYSQNNLRLERTSRDTPKYLKAVVLQCGALFAWIDETNQNPQIISHDDPQEDPMFYIDLTHWKSPYKGIIENQEVRKVGLSETLASGNWEASTHNDWWKANWWNKYQQERSRRTWNDEVWEFLKRVLYVHSPNPGDELKIFLSRWSCCDECWFVLSTVFFRKVFRTSYTCSSNYSVYDGGVHTLTCRTYISLLHSVFAHIFMRVHTHAWLKVHEKGVCRMCVFDLSISPSLFSCLAYPCCSCTVTSRPLLTTTSLTPTSTWSCRTFPS